MIDFSMFDRVFGFGDSTSDSGNAAVFVPSVTDPSLGYVDNRFTNGANYFDLIFAEVSGRDALDYEPSFGFAFADPGPLAFGGNYSLGGATAETGLAAQVGSFAATLSSGTTFGASLLPTDLVAINLGGNDLLDFVANNDLSTVSTATINTFASDVAMSFESPLTSLIAFGAEHILMSGAPNVGITPSVTNDFFGGNQTAAISAVAPVSEATNTALLGTIDTISAANRDVTFYYFEPTFDDVLANPGQFGFSASLLDQDFVSDFTAPGSTLTLNDIDQYAFIDDVHISQNAQANLFALAQSAILIGGPTAVRDELLLGTSGADTIDGYGGNDEIIGDTGADLLLGSAGNDVLIGDAEVDVEALLSGLGL